jgi:hypothetical protein
MVRSCCSVIVKTKNTLLFNKYPIGEETMLNRYLILITIMIKETGEDRLKVCATCRW